MMKAPLRPGTRPVGAATLALGTGFACRWWFILSTHSPSFLFTKLPPTVPHYRPLVGWSVVFGRTQGRQRLVGRSGYGAQVR